MNVRKCVNLCVMVKCLFVHQIRRESLWAWVLIYMWVTLSLLECVIDKVFHSKVLKSSLKASAYTTLRSCFPSIFHLKIPKKGRKNLENGKKTWKKTKNKNSFYVDRELEECFLKKKKPFRCFLNQFKGECMMRNNEWIMNEHEKKKK